MAKKEQEYSYGSTSIPNGEKKYSVIRWGWNGLNRTDEIDTGQLTDTSGVMIDPPYVYPVKKPKMWLDFADGIPFTDGNYVMFHNLPTETMHSGTPISIYGKDRILCMIWRDDDDDKFRFSELLTAPGFSVPRVIWYEIIDAELGDSTGYDPTDLVPRSIVQFNVADTHTGNVAEYTYDRKLLIYPDCYSIKYGLHTPFLASNFNPDGTIPVSDKAAVYGSRVFGVTDDAVFASEFNSYVGYDLDTADDTSSAHAWWSMAGSNTDANGKFTAVASYDNHVVVFRKDFMQLVYNNKNPFRIVDVGAFGCDNNNAWTILNGVLYFASQSKVYSFTGGTPKDITKKLEIEDLTGAVLGSYKDTVWLQTKDTIYTYKDGVWSDIGSLEDSKVIQFTTLDFGIVGLVKTDNGDDPPTYSIRFFDWDLDCLNGEIVDPESWEPQYGDDWWFVTDLMALGKLDVRRVKKMSVLCYGNEGAEISAYLLPDNVKWDLDEEEMSRYLVGSLTFDKEKYKMMRVLTRQFSGTMHRLYFKGSGFVRVHAAELKISWGGDLYRET